MADRAEAVDGLRPLFAGLAARLGLPGSAEVRYRPRSGAGTEGALIAELAERRAADLERGFTAHGPHRDELQLLLGDVGLRAYGSQGQQRAALLALLFAERTLLADRRARPPLMLLDDVMSELDAERRELLADLLRSGGQSVITTTEAEHVPGAALAGGGVIRVENGTIAGTARAVAA
jgi:DNA replication and repair protein RecF